MRGGLTGIQPPFQKLGEGGDATPNPPVWRPCLQETHTVESTAIT